MSAPFHVLPSLAALVARDVVVSYSDRVVLDGVDVLARPGRPLGLVGGNGAGKSTLLRVLAGAQSLDAGSVTRPGDLALLLQEPDFPDGATVTQVLETALAPLHLAVARLEHLATRLDEPGRADEYDELLTWASLREAWDAERRAEVAAARLGLAAVDPDSPVAELSGGQRSRLALAALVTRRPQCVLLDEPTNHLDDAGAALLEDFVRSLPGVAVVASHDRTFLDAVCAEVLDLDPSHLGLDGGGGTRFTGGYSAYLRAKHDARRRWEEAFASQRAELAALRRAAATTARQVAHDRPARDNDRFIYRFKGQNVARSISRRVRDAEHRIEVLERDRVPRPPAPISFRGTLRPAHRDSGPVVCLRDLRVDDRLALGRLDVRSGDRLLVTGTNGSGKSTLLKVVAGRVEPTVGVVEVRAARTGYLPQDVTFRRPDLTPGQVYARLVGDGPDGPPVPLRDLGLLHPRDVGRPVGSLSVGQQRRLALAVLVAGRPSLMLLDEPTNHLSLALAEELEDALGHFPGTVVVATHDRWLRRRWSGDHLELASSG